MLGIFDNFPSIGSHVLLWLIVNLLVFFLYVFVSGFIRRRMPSNEYCISASGTWYVRNKNELLALSASICVTTINDLLRFENAFSDLGVFHIGGSLFMTVLFIICILIPAIEGTVNKCISLEYFRENPQCDADRCIPSEHLRNSLQCDTSKCISMEYLKNNPQCDANRCTSLSYTEIDNNGKLERVRLYLVHDDEKKNTTEKSLFGSDQNNYQILAIHKFFSGAKNIVKTQVFITGAVLAIGLFFQISMASSRVTTEEIYEEAQSSAEDYIHDSIN